MVAIRMRAAAGTFGRELRMAAAMRPVLLYLGLLAAVAAVGALLALVNRSAAYAHDGGGHAAHTRWSAGDATPIRLLEPADDATVGDRRRSARPAPRRRSTEASSDIELNSTAP